MDVDDYGRPELAFVAAPLARVSLPPISAFLSPAPRRLSSCFSEPSRAAIPAARKKVAWVSLQGRLVDAEEAASARAIGGGLAPEEAAAWELFTPLQRVLVVATVAAAAAESKKARRIGQLQKSVDVRDQVLLDMQQKLDHLCEQLNSLNDHSREYGDQFFALNDEFSGDERLEVGVKSHSGEHQVCKLNPQNGIVPLETVSSNERRAVARSDSKESDVFFIPNMVEQEERRMSDLSDFCPSVTSSLDVQFSALAAEQDFYNLRKECEEKDEVIKELNAAAHASNVASSKRITELEDVVRRKSMVITKLKKDMVVLEHKLIQLTRLQRPSFVGSNSIDSKPPVMSSNLLYDMSSSSPSSSDSDCPTEKSEQQIKSSIPQVKCESSQKGCPAATESGKASSSKNSTPRTRSSGKQQQRSRSPLKENCWNYTPDSDMILRSKRLVSSEGDPKHTRRHVHQDSRRTMSQRRWL